MKLDPLLFARATEGAVGAELTRDEFFDVYRIFRPAASREQLQADWDEFQKLRA